MSQPRGQRDEDVLSFLNSLDTYSSPTSGQRQPLSRSVAGPGTAQGSVVPSQLRSKPVASQHAASISSSAAGAGAPKTADEAQSVLDFLDELTQRTTTPTTATKAAPTSNELRKKTSVPTGLQKSTSNRSLAGGQPASSGAAHPPLAQYGASHTGQAQVGSNSANSIVGTSQPRRSTDSVRSQRSATGAAPGSGLSTSPRAVGSAGPRSIQSSAGSSAVTTNPAPHTTVPIGAPQQPPQHGVRSFSAKPGQAVVGQQPPASFQEPTLENVADDSLRDTNAPQPPVAPQAASAPSASTSGGGGGGGGWGWSSVWSQATNVMATASSVVQQARNVAEEQVKTASKVIGESEQAKKWSEGVREYAKNAHLDQIGENLKSTTMRGLTDLLNAVAPPIAEHEVIEVTLSHDMVGYEGVETLVYRGLAKVMESVEGGSLVLNQKDDKGRKSTSDDEERNLNMISGLQEGWKGAEAKLDELVKTSFAPQSKPKDNDGLTIPVKNCPVYMRIQPCLANLPFLPPSLTTAGQGEGPKASQVLFFLLLLKDPTHNLMHSSLSQSMPAAWLDIPFEENEWVEDAMVEIIRRSVEIIGQEYIQHRMRAQANAISKVREEAQRTLKEQAPSAPPGPQLTAEEQREREEESQAAAAVARATV
ncbi:hypothetical protein OIO90_005002 [Microbotryomycetes sp. JL221]|nr:hypothetical protein OIO90_005002 [Microbotryomycetes sp. JL221]